MEFWGVEVKAGTPLKVVPDEDYLIHLSQASIGESKKGKSSDSVPLFVTIDGKKLVIGTLSQESFPQIPYDLVFEKEFELSHNWKHGSVYFTGYKTPFQEEDDDAFGDFDSDEEEEMMTLPTDGKVAPAKAKPIAAKSETSDSDDDESDEDDESDDESGEDAMEEDDEDDGSEPDSEEEELKKAEQQSKKRANGVAPKTPVSSKKAKIATPEKTDGKKGGHTATPHPAKKGSKTPASGTKSPKSGGQFSCKSCPKTFSSDVGLKSHSKDKHADK